jgi:hypothetical protein
MDLQHEPVLEAHPRHLGQHLRPEELRVLSRRAAAEHPLEQRLGGGRRQVRGAGGRMAVIR